VVREEKVELGDLFSCRRARMPDMTGSSDSPDSFEVVLSFTSFDHSDPYQVEHREASSVNEMRLRIHWNCQGTQLGLRHTQ
jgi:hypothetical protein